VTVGELLEKKIERPLGKKNARRSRNNCRAREVGKWVPRA